MQIVKPDNSRRDDAAVTSDGLRTPIGKGDAASPGITGTAPRTPSPRRASLSITTGRFSADSIESASGMESDIPDLLEPYRLIDDEYVESRPTEKERKEARDRQKRRAKRRAMLDKQLDKYAREHPEATPEEAFRAVFPKVEKKRSKRRRSKSAIIVMLLGALLLAFPIVSDLYASWQADQAITSYSQKVSEMTQEEKDAMMAQAVSYNHILSGGSLPDDVDVDDLSYYDILDVTGTGIMGSIMIECIGVNQPIYHGTEESTLMIGVGHLEGTSFPIPTGSTYAAIAGHTGMPGQRMFDELVDLEEGDKLHVKILDEDTWYQVIGTEVVDPDHKNTFSPEEGRDMLTLITCTPYGINDHRLLVHCEKLDLDQSQTDFGIITEDKLSKYLNLRTIPIIFAVLFLIASIIWKVMRKLRRKVGNARNVEEEKKRKREAAIENAIAVGSERYASDRRSAGAGGDQANRSSSGIPE